ncbi:MAG TPA: bifunctional acetate--CoA ligase family protein/GNAT family N-acetyltransferase [Polyangiales bacterium]|nr:bifunctional acetate--CoA ligase family protein/GNAT family N-acetyltransferase [Polyangiales bacterium]
MRSHDLERLFDPRSVAVFGASERPDAVAARVFENLHRADFEGELYPINPKHETVLGHRCYPDIESIGASVDLAVVATPARTVPEIIHRCGEHGVSAAIVLTAGFRESGPRGRKLEREMLAEARRYRMRLIGPNCLGVVRPSVKLNATFSKDDALPGGLALVSQSGAICTAILDWANSRRIGFSALVSMGDASDVDFGDMLDYLALDAKTQAILLYVEGVGDARSFMSGLRAAARLKPVVIVKAGRHSEGLKAAVSHTGALVGSDDVFDAAIRRAGAVRAMTIDQLFAAAQLLSKRRHVKGDRLAMVTNAGGPGVMATDRAVDLGVKVAELGEETLERLHAALPEHWSGGNPVDILGDAAPADYELATKACLADPNVDGLLVMLTPQAMTDPLESARVVAEIAQKSDKPVLACWMGDSHVRDSRELLRQKGIPSFANPEGSVEAFGYLTSYHRNQRLLLQVPPPLGELSEPDIAGADLIIDAALAERRTLLTMTESKAVLSAFGIPVTMSIEVQSANEALVAAESLGFPVAMKIIATDLTHKTDVGGVRLNIANAQAVRSTYKELVSSVASKTGKEYRSVAIERMHVSASSRELLVGVARDPVFGPVISFGAGGMAVEIHRDRAIALPPINGVIASSLISRTRVSRMLGEYRGMPAADMTALEQVLGRVSEMACELPRLKELDINPLLVDEHGVVAADARIVVEPEEPAVNRYQHMAVHPYPNDLVRHWQTAEGQDITIRPIRPEDAEIEQAFVRKLSPKAKHFRFMQGVRELTPEMLVRFTQLDYDRELALIAVVQEDGEEREIAVARYAMNPDGETCEFAVVVADEWQGRGVGSEVMRQLMNAAKNKGIARIQGQVLKENAAMLKLMGFLGFESAPSEDDPSILDVYRELHAT